MSTTTTTTTTATIRPPKILPWIARRYDLPLEHAEALWRQAVLMANLWHGRDRESSDYWRDCIETFLRLAADEAPKNDSSSQCGSITALDVLQAQDRVRRRTLAMVERMLRCGTQMWSPRPIGARRRALAHH